ncbi:unnamed protein product [Adineta ricciae]|uniref:Uncharacterized protein n=2 Tax=Adineta ricciae TaxID=249248 RepID=A0A813XS46_ADIRI|nr:unnamed protein product [Adineta ricciae]
MTSSAKSSSESTSGSISSSAAGTTTPIIQQLDKRLWRSIDFLHLISMIFALYTAIIVAILRNELFEQCPLYAKLYLRDNATYFSTETIDRQTVWGSVYTCEFASFAYLSAFVLSFISLWLHIVFRRLIRTDRLLRLPIGIVILIFTLVTISATIVVTDGVIKFCLNSQNVICSSEGEDLFARSRWKIFTLPAGGWLTSISILLNTIARLFQLFAKPKKSAETLKALVQQLMTKKYQHKAEKESSEYGSQISQSSREQMRPSTPTRRYSSDQIHNHELYPYYHPSIPQYRQIKKRSCFQRLCCPCFRRRRRQRSFHEVYRPPYVIPDEYFHRLNHLRQNGSVSPNRCHHHSMRHPVEQQTQTDPSYQPKSIEPANQTPFVGRRRSSVRFEDETPPTPIPIIKEKVERKPEPVAENDLQRNVSFRNNEDDLWTTVTIDTKQSVPIQSSHFNRLSLENLSRINTSISNNDNGVTAIQINSTPCTESKQVEPNEKEIPAPPPLLLPSLSATTCSIRNRQKPQICSKPLRTRYKSPPVPPSRTLTTSSEDDTDLRNIKPVEEINRLVADKYNYNDISKALKSNVERLKSTFLAQENQSHYDKPRHIRSNAIQKTREHSSDC